MSRVDAAAADRLPWLPDEPERRPAKRRHNFVLAWALAAVTAVAGAGFWIGTQGLLQQPAPAPRAAPTTTVRLPAPQPAQAPEVRMAAQPEVNPPPAPQVRPSPVHELKIAPPPARGTHDEAGAAPASDKGEQASPAPAVAAPAAGFVMPKPWNPRIFAGASGRVVQIGAFGSVRQAKQGWWYMVRSYPAVSRLPAVVRPSRKSKGRTFYRFQVGTTSQAHSEGLCQRMQRIHFSCAVVGLPWKSKVER
jgi:hypothetical protein